VGPSIKRKLVEKPERDVVECSNDIGTTNAIMRDMFSAKTSPCRRTQNMDKRRIEYRDQKMHSLQREVGDIINSSADV